MSICINKLIQQLNLPNTLVSTAHPNSYLLTAKLEPLFTTYTVIRYSLPAVLAVGFTEQDYNPQSRIAQVCCG